MTLLSRMWPIFPAWFSVNHIAASGPAVIPNGKLVPPTFEDGLKNQRVLAAVEESHQKGRWVKLD